MFHGSPLPFYLVNGHHFHPTWLTAEREEWKVDLYSVQIRSLVCDTQMQGEVGFSVPQLPRLVPLIQSTVTSEDLVKHLVKQIANS